MLESQLITPRTKFQAVLLEKNSGEDTQIIVMGGKNGKAQRIDSVEIYNCEKDTWSEMENLSMTRAKSGFACVSVKVKKPLASPARDEKVEQQIYLIGGNDGKVLNTVEILEYPACSWKQMTPMNHRRDELAACIGPDNKIYVVGGYGGGDNTCLNSAERYDPYTNTWEEL